ncbi:MAG: penicillin-binding protein [Myxococcota bacterium]
MRDLKSTRLPSTGRWLRLRVALIGIAFLLLLGSVLARAVTLQVFERDKLKKFAQDQYLRHIEIPARRGDIFDRKGAPLAQSVEVDSIWLDPSQVDDLTAASRKLAAAVHADVGELHARVSKGKKFVWVKRQATSSEVAAVKALALSGIGFAKEPRRFYPQRELAAHVIGVVGTDGHGLDGLELAFEDELSGQSARLAGLRDAKGRKLLTAEVGDARAQRGASVVLTLDGHLQHLAEKALTRAAEESRAAGGVVVVLDPHTGELLALANYPRFNPNAPAGVTHDHMRNRAALDTFEPGSTFKAFVVAAALEEKVISLHETFFCENGRWNLGRHTINDTHPYGELTAARVLQVSSNICAAKIAQKLGRERLVDAYARFGFGERVGLALPGEGKGVIPFPKAEVALATQAFGQGLTATAVQLAAGYGALANGGVLMRPHLVSRVVDSDGLVLLDQRPAEVRRVVSERTAKAVVSMLEAVVTREGTAPQAYLAEYRVAGKTGTAQKADPVARGYSDKRIASFVGIVPANDPRLVVLVVIDEPKTDVYGGLVAAPAFKEIAAAAMPYLGVPPLPLGEGKGEGRQLPPLTPTLSHRERERERGSPLADAFAKVEAMEAVTERTEEGSVRVPDLSGLGARPAVSKLLAVALEPRLSGSGRVVGQTPLPGSLVGKGARVTVELAGALPP